MHSDSIAIGEVLGKLHERKRVAAIVLQGASICWACTSTWSDRSLADICHGYAVRRSTFGLKGHSGHSGPEDCVATDSLSSGPEDHRRHSGPKDRFEAGSLSGNSFQGYIGR